MTDLKQSLSKADYSHLKVVAEKWELPFNAPDARKGLNQLVELLFNSRLFQQAAVILPEQEQDALLWLEAQGGKVPWDHFTRRYGEIRELGAGRLERERPDLDPISPAESLWYRALVGRGFYQSESGLQEFAYLPDDIRSELIPYLASSQKSFYPRDFSCRKAAPREFFSHQLASAVCVDHLCTLIAGLRMDLDPGIHLPDVSTAERNFYQQLCCTAGLLDEERLALPDKIRDFFDLSREDALLMLWQSWRLSPSHLDLRMIESLQIEGSPEMDPVRIREQIIGYIQALDPEAWWSVESFISQIKELDPDILRTGGEYQSWFIKETETGDFLTGFSRWDQVEGALVRYLLTGPLHWLGLIDLGCPEDGASPMAFRRSDFEEDLISGNPPRLASKDPDQVQVRSKGEIRMTANVLPRTRYQIARFCDWYPVKAEAYLYGITPASLARAERQDLRTAHLISLLENHTQAVPPNLLTALERWEKQGVQASISRKTVLRLGSPAVLKALKKSKASRFILEQLGPTTLIVQEGSEAKIAEALVELGFFLEIVDQTGSQI